MRQAIRPYFGLAIGVSLVFAACGGVEPAQDNDDDRAEVLDEFMVQGMNTAEESWAFSISRDTIQASCAAGTVMMTVRMDGMIVYEAYDTDNNLLGSTNGWDLDNGSVAPSIDNYGGEEEGARLIKGFVRAMQQQFAPDEQMAADLNALLKSYEQGDVQSINQWLNENYRKNLLRLFALTGTIIFTGLVGIALPGLGAIAMGAGIAIMVESLYSAYLLAFGPGDGPVPDLIYLGTCDPRVAQCAMEPLFEVMM